MATFFINTSKKEFDSYEALFDVYKENLEFVRMDLPLVDWTDKEKGYFSCVRKMGEMIDGYIDLNNHFSLIIYLDLHERKEYAAIGNEQNSYCQRAGRAEVLHDVYLNYFKKTIVNELVRSGRTPESVLIMFGEEQDKKMGNVNEAQPLIKDKQCYFDEYCQDEALLLNDEYICSDDGKRDFSTFQVTVQHDAERTHMTFVSCPYESFACAANKKEKMMSTLSVAIHLLKCIERGTVLQPEMIGETGEIADISYPRPIPFLTYEHSGKEILEFLQEKRDRYKEMRKHINISDKSYADLGLVDKIEPFSYTDFGLTKYGDTESDDTESDDTESDDTDNGFESIEFVQFCNNAALKGLEECGGETETAAGGTEKTLSPDEYKKRAKAVKKEHTEFLKKLRGNVSYVLDRYAGRSGENESALLSSELQVKRSGETEEDTVNHGIEPLKESSERAYQTILRRYMRFCAGRSVKMTDFEEQYDWFIARVDAITANLNTIKYAAIRLLAVLFLLYIPLFIIGANAIFSDMFTFIIGLGSFLVPLALLYAVFLIVVLQEKKQYGTAWKEFIQKSDKAMEKNRKAVREYYSYLFRAIPSLRRTYDHKLDVKYYAEGCVIAGSKLKHHRDKLAERIDALEAMIGDLEEAPHEGRRGADADPIDADKIAKKIDLELPYCTGEKNRAFYLILTESELPAADLAMNGSDANVRGGTGV